MTAETTRTLVANDSDETFELELAEESELLAAIAKAECGKLISASELLDTLRD